MECDRHFVGCKKRRTIRSQPFRGPPLILQRRARVELSCEVLDRIEYSHSGQDLILHPFAIDLEKLATIDLMQREHLIQSYRRDIPYDPIGLECSHDGTGPSGVARIRRHVSTSGFRSQSLLATARHFPRYSAASSPHNS